MTTQTSEEVLRGNLPKETPTEDVSKTKEQQIPFPRKPTEQQSSLFEEEPLETKTYY